MAGTVGSATYGVAKATELVAVRVLGADGGGRASDIVAGIDWVVRQPTLGKRKVINMSLGTSESRTINRASDQATTNSNIVVVAAAGNENIDACQVSPASASRILTVAASDKNDVRSTFSNFGDCVDIFAPGTSIISTSEDGTVKVLSGTSMASPHVAGVAALYLDAYPSLTAAEVMDLIIGEAANDIIANVNGSPNLFVNTQNVSGLTPISGGVGLSVGFIGVTMVGVGFVLAL